MDWYQVLVVFGGNISLFLWAVRQSRNDYLHLDKKLEENRKETNQLINAIREDIKEFHIRMERQDAEFRARAEKLDTEFKAHMMYEHKKDKK